MYVIPLSTVDEMANRSAALDFTQQPVTLRVKFDVVVCLLIKSDALVNNTGAMEYTRPAMFNCFFLI